ncbi:unnamed protein product [Paramecium primaurelia]|uniref:DNA-3-methyladenine glycosylase II n=1 Tax=Paramecium primaurelia TaxID=5886 RepID=A0A8S1NL22_PARPR|nr:unnamed protein product [Paramecium primaurelia]
MLKQSQKQIQNNNEDVNTKNEIIKKNLNQKRQKQNNPAEQFEPIETILDSAFYKVDVIELAQKLIGKIIVRQLPQGEVRALIVEAEAYKAPEDKACHAYNNKKTERTQYFWQDGGHLYIYSIYGNNYCLNITAATKNDPEAVLIRAIQPLKFEIVQDIRKIKSFKLQELSNGPGKCGECLQLNKSHNGLNLCDKDSGMYLIDNQIKYEIGISSRINIDYAEEYKDKPWRFYIKNNSFVSKKG